MKNTFFIFATLTCSGIASANTLEQKLDQQFSLFEKARKHIIERVGYQKGIISRQEWEAMLFSEPLELTEGERSDLAAIHQKLIEQARQKAFEESALDLSLLRNNSELLQRFCADLPKGGMLHVHLSGTPSRETIKKLLLAKDPQISHSKIYELIKGWLEPHELDFLKPVQDLTAFSDLNHLHDDITNLFVLPPGNGHSFKRFIGPFVLQSIFRTPDNAIAISEAIMRDFLARAREQGVTYVEITNVPSFDYPIILENLSEFEQHIEEWQKEFGIFVRFNYSFNRLDHAEKNRDQATLLAKINHPYIRGVDLLNDETNTPALEQGQTVYATLSALAPHLSFTMHAGELGHQSNSRDAILLGAKRIGHGVMLQDDIVALEYARRRNLGVECNIVSNLRLGIVLHQKQHPFLTYLRLGLKPSLSTDDEGIFETEMNREFTEAIEHSDISYAEVKQLVLNSLETAFVEEDIKKVLLNRLKQDLAAFEQRWLPLLTSID